MGTRDLIQPLTDPTHYRVRHHHLQRNDGPRSIMNESTLPTNGVDNQQAIQSS